MGNSITNREAFKNNKETVLSYLEETKNYFSSADNEDMVNSLSKIIQDVKDGIFSIVVIGEFSAGKSTFLNALMGERLLPSFIKETTATTNFLRHTKNGESANGIVVYNDGKEKKITDLSVKELEKYVSTKGDNVAQDVSYVDLYLDSPFLEDNVTLVDCPGLNGVKKHHKDITMRQIDKSSACIFMFRGVQPGTETDFNVLRDLDEKMNNIMFVLNQIDFIEDSGDSDVKDVIDNITENYKIQFPNKSSMPKIYPISAKRALESREKAASDKNSTAEKRRELLKASRIEAFEERLMEFLTKGEKGKAMLTSPLNKIISFLDEEITHLKNEEAALSDKADAEDINKNIEIVEEAIEESNRDMKAKNKDISKQLDMIYDNTIAFISDEVKAFSEENKKEIKEIADHDEFYSYASDLQNKVDLFTCRLADEANSKFNMGVKKITAEKYDEAAKSVSDMIKKDDLQLELKVNFSYTEPDYDSYTKKYEEEKKAIEENITQLESKLEDLDRSSIKARRIQREIDRENAKISSIESRIDELDNQIKPRATKTKEEYVIRVNRGEGGGVLPKLGDIIFGPKAVKTYSDKWDYSQVKEWESDMKNRKSELSKSIEDANNNISKLKNTLTEDPDYIELQKIKNTKNKNEYENKLKELKEKHKEEFQKRAAKDLRNARNKIERYLNIDVEKTIKKMMEIKFEAKKESLESIIADITETEIKARCKKEQDKLENLKKQLNDSAEEKQTRLAQIKKNMEIVGGIYDKASLLNNQLEAKTAVKIETEQLRRD